MGTRDEGMLTAGVVLFLLGLLTGLLLASGAAIVANPRGLLAGHMEAMMNGMFLMLVGLIFGRVVLSSGWRALCRGALLYGAFANWCFSSFTGILGTSEATPIAGAGYHGTPFAEQAMLVGLVSVALATLVGVVLLLVGLRRPAATPSIAMVG